MFATILPLVEGQNQHELGRVELPEGIGNSHDSWSRSRPIGILCRFGRLPLTTLEARRLHGPYRLDKV